MISSMPKIRFDVLESWRVSPETMARIAQRVRIRDIGGSDERPDRAERVGRLAARPLPVCELQVARRDVVGDDIAAYRLERVLLRDVLHRRADHDPELGLVVALRHDRRDHDRIAGADQRGRVLREEERRLGQLDSLLLGVVPVVETDADDLAGTIDGHHAPILRDVIAARVHATGDNRSSI